MEEEEKRVEASKLANCTWEEFSLHDTERLLDPSTGDYVVRQILSERLELNNYQTKQRQILLDLYTYTWSFGKKELYSPAQLSTILSVVKRIHAKCTSTARENLKDVLTYFQELMVQHSVNRPPFSHSIFTPCQVKSITDFIFSTYFKHYKLYKYAFTKKLHLNVSLSYAGEVEQEEDEIQEEEELTEGASEFVVIFTHQHVESYGDVQAVFHKSWWIR